MNSISVGLITVISIFGGTLFGMYLGSILPEHHLRENTKETVKLASGMIATLAALVLGLLVASAKNSFDTTGAEMTQVGSKIMLLDRLLARYGPEAKPIRQDLRDALADGIKRVWPDKKSATAGSAALEERSSFAKVQDELFALKPTTDFQRATLAQAEQVSNDMLQSRWLLIEQTQGALPTPFFIVLLSWLTMLFISIGLFAPRNGTAIGALFLCALSFSAAIFLIVEMNHPLDGIVKVSSAPLRKVLEHLGQ
jgi:hypothetical protein